MEIVCEYKTKSITYRVDSNRIFSDAITCASAVLVSNPPKVNMYCEFDQSIFELVDLISNRTTVFLRLTGGECTPLIEQTDMYKSIITRGFRCFEPTVYVKYRLSVA